MASLKIRYYALLSGEPAAALTAAGLRCVYRPGPTRTMSPFGSFRKCEISSAPGGAGVSRVIVLFNANVWPPWKAICVSDDIEGRKRRHRGKRARDRNRHAAILLQDRVHREGPEAGVDQPERAGTPGAGVEDVRENHLRPGIGDVPSDFGVGEGRNRNRGGDAGHLHRDRRRHTGSNGAALARDAGRHSSNVSAIRFVPLVTTQTAYTSWLVLRLPLTELAEFGIAKVKFVKPAAVGAGVLRMSPAPVVGVHTELNAFAFGFCSTFGVAPLTVGVTVFPGELLPDPQVRLRDRLEIAIDRNVKGARQRNVFALFRCWRCCCSIAWRTGRPRGRYFG